MHVTNLAPKAILDTTDWKNKQNNEGIITNIKLPEYNEKRYKQSFRNNRKII
jgi:hypothetical protein